MNQKLYKRLELDPPGRHEIEDLFGMFKQIQGTDQDSGRNRHLALNDLYDQSFNALSKLESALRGIPKDFERYTPEYRQQATAEYLRPPRQAVLSIIKDHIQRRQRAMDTLQESIMKITAPRQETDPVVALKSELRMQEIRTLLRAADMEQRKALIKAKLDKDDMSYLHACIDAPDPLVGQDTLREWREEYAFTRHPELREAVEDCEDAHEKTRKRCGDINATAISMLNKAGIPDTATPEDHADAFPPQDPYTNALSDKRIEKQKHKEFLQERQKQIQQEE